MNVFVTVSCVFLLILVMVDATLTEKFSISEKLCISKDICFCKYICVRKPTSDHELWKIDMITTRDESCHQLEIPEHVSALVPNRKIYYKIYMKEGTKEFKMYYFHSEPKETQDSETDVTLTSQESVLEDLNEQFQIILHKYMYEKEIIYIKNINSFLEDISADGVIFGYELNTHNNTKENLSVAESSDNRPKDINILLDYFSNFKTNAVFIPAIKSVQPKSYNSWFQLKEYLSAVINSAKEVDVRYYHVFNGYVNLTSEVDKDFLQENRITYLIKFVFINDNMIVFLIPENESNTENVHEPCPNICQKHGWFLGQNEYVICCNPIRIKEISPFAQILQGTGLKYPVMPIRETPDGDVKLLWHSTSSTTNNGKNLSFCAYTFIQYMGENMPLNILMEVPNTTFCNSTYQMQNLGRNPTILGLLINFVDKSVNENKKIIFQNTFKEALNTFSAADIGPIWTEINKNWIFFTPRRLLGNDYSTCFIKLGESISVPNGALGYRYAIPRNTIHNTLFSNYYVPTTHDCETTNTYPISVRSIFSKVNIEKKFRNLIQNLEPETVNEYLEHLQNNNYLTPVSHIARSDLLFRGFEFSYSCTIIPMWKSIFSEYWIHIEDAVHDIVKEKSIDAQIYTLEYKPLIHIAANNDKLFHLFQHEGNSEGNFLVHRFIIKMVISEVGSIAFLTINDVFLLMNGKESPFTKRDDDITDLCVLPCGALGFPKLNTQKVKLNYCCEVNTNFINTILEGKIQLKAEQEQHLRLSGSLNRPNKRKRDILL